MDQMWKGRFSKELDSRVNDFNSSISFDSRMYKEDIAGSIAHATMLGNQGIIDKEESSLIVKTLNDILSDLSSGVLKFDMQAEDIHMFIEAELTKRIGTTGKKLHTARSRNDQVALDMKLYVKNEIKQIKALLLKLIATLVKIAEENVETIMPGYTHLQRAQPVTFAHYMMAYVEMFKRDYMRLSNTLDIMNYSPLGSGALASTTYPIDREFTAAALGFKGPTLNSIDGVSDRDFCVEAASDIALTMVHLSRLSEEIVLWCSWEFKFIELDDSFATGSSIMPQKKNPDITELIRGKAARTIGDLNTLLIMMKGLPLAYNKDMQEDKDAIFDAIDTVEICIKTIIPMLDTMKVIGKNMENGAKKGFINATDVADYLVKKGLAFRDAYKITGEIVKECIDKDLTLDTLPLSIYKNYSDAFAGDIYEAIDLATCVNGRNVIGGPAKDTELKHISLIKQFLKGNELYERLESED